MLKTSSVGTRLILSRFSARIFAASKVFLFFSFSFWHIVMCLSSRSERNLRLHRGQGVRSAESSSGAGGCAEGNDCAGGDWGGGGGGGSASSSTVVILDGGGDE